MAKDYTKFNVFCDIQEDSEAFVIGDLHGCWQEMLDLLERLGYTVDAEGMLWALKGSPAARKKLIFVGDLVDRGPDIASVLRFFMKNWRRGPAFFPSLKAKKTEESQADTSAEEQLPERRDEDGKDWTAAPVYCVLGNHDYRLWRLLQGCNVKFTHGLDLTVESLQKACQEGSFTREGQSFDFPFSLEDVYAFLQDLPVCLRCRERFIVSHAGLSEPLQTEAENKTFHFCIFGDTTGKMDEHGFPIRNHWEEEYRGKAAVFYGHTPVRQPLIVNNTFNIDTGCVFGGRLTAVSYPEGELISVESRRVYCEKEYW